MLAAIAAEPGWMYPTIRDRNAQCRCGQQVVCAVSGANPGEDAGGRLQLIVRLVEEIQNAMGGVYVNELLMLARRIAR